MKIGIHNSKKSKIIKNKNYKSLNDGIIYETELLNLNATQIFTHGPRNLKENKIDYQSIKKYCHKNSINLYVHGSYQTIGIWSVEFQKSKKSKKSQYMIEHIINSIHSCIKLNAKGLIIHLKKSSVADICYTLRKLSNIEEIKKIKNKMPPILLELPAMKPCEKTFEDPKKLNILCQSLINEDLIPWGFCIDTAHLWSSGINLSQPLSWYIWCSNLTTKTKNKIKLIHLNGSPKINFKTGKDKHIIPFSEEDGIWRTYIRTSLRNQFKDQKKNIKFRNNDLNLIKSSSFYSILIFCIDNNIDVICEINRGEFYEVKLFFKLITSLTSFSSS